MRPGSLVARAWEFFDALTWIALLNLAWIAFTLLGGVVFGFAPSTVAASALVRRRVRGDLVRPLTAFWGVYRAEFFRANVLLMPVAFGMAALLFSWQYFERGPDALAGILAGLALVLLGLCAAVGAVLVPLYCSYELPLHRYLPSAVAFTVANPLLLVLVLATVSGVLVLSWYLPGIVPFFTVGLLSYLSTRLSLDFIDRNENRLAASTRSPASLAP